MKYDFKSQTAKLLREHQKNRQWLIAFLCLALTVVLGTLAALKLYGQAMTHQVKVLECSFEVHKHTEECYKEGAEKELICGYADYVVHVHNDDCRDESGKLVCQLEEVEVHEHKDGEDGCWKEERILICGKEETAGAQPQAGENQEPVKGDLNCGREAHTHNEGCYSQAFTCGAEEHTHNESCYDEEGKLTCGAEEHSHNEGCYSQTLTCGVEEHAHEDACYDWITPEAGESQAEGHVHTDACYAVENVLSCGKLELHTHTDECYAKESFDEKGNLIEGSLPVCGLLQLEEHVHAKGQGDEDGCFRIAELTADEVAALNAGATLHIHEESCYDEENNLICGHETTHLHGKECYDETGRLICEFAGNHVHSKECYDEENNLICGYEILSHVHGKECYDEENNLICGYETASHVHEESCYDRDGNLQCGYETASHLHEESCYDEERNLICGYETARHLHEESCYDEEGNLICGYETAKHVHVRNCYDEEGNVICGYESDGNDVELTTEVDGITITLFGPAYSFEEGKEYSIQAEIVKDEEVLATVEEAVAALEEQLAEAAGLTTGEETEAAAEESDEMTEEPDAAAEEAAEADTTEEDSAEVPEEADITEDSAEGSEETQEDASEPAEEFEEADLTGEESPEEGVETVKQVDSYQAFDIRLFADGEEVQPLGPVGVRFSSQEIAQSVEDEKTDVMVIHVDENTGEMTDMEAVATEESDLVIETDHFSVYVYVNLTDIFGQITVTVEHWGENITTIDGTAVATQEDKDGVKGDTAFETGENPYVKTKEEDCEIYSTDTIKAIPNEYYADITKLSKICNVGDKSNYTAIKVWVCSGNNAEVNKGKATWTGTYEEYTLTGSDTQINLKEGDLIRFWYTPKKAEDQLPTPANFYDYDTTDGNVIQCKSVIIITDILNVRSSKSTTNGNNILGGVKKDTWLRLLNDEGDGWYKVRYGNRDAYISSNSRYSEVRNDVITTGYLKAEEKGINVSGNFIGNGGKFGIGQQASGNLSSWAAGDNQAKLNGENLNSFNFNGKNAVVKGIVKDTLTADGKLQYNVSVPKSLFEGGIGSTAYTNYNLTFKQDGDTYTLQHVYNIESEENVTGDLTKFDRYTEFNSDYPFTRTHGAVYSNNFWPMDDVYGTDPHMGARMKQYRFLYDNGSELAKKDAPNPSDDNLEHNWHFGMTYQIDFTIGDYTGPMEYYFRGDDDFWLFIDGKLAVDIGGIHSSVGETLDLRTWMQNKGMLTDKNKKHTMKIFYMERGGFGSCCYMQFTLPNSEPVSMPTPETTEYSVKKEWEDDDNPFRPISIMIELLQVLNGSETETGVKVELNEENDWKYSWSGLPKINGSSKGEYEYTYRVTELNLPDGYEFTLVNGKLTNKLTSSGKTSVGVHKDWINDGVVSDTYRPNEVKIQLYYLGKENGNDVYLPYKDLKGNTKIVTLNKENGWYAKFENLPKYYYEEGNTTGIEVVYSIRELDKEGKPIESSTGNPGYIISNQDGAKYEVSYSKDEPDTSDSTVDATNTEGSAEVSAVASSTSFTVTNRLPARFKIVKMGKKEEDSTKDVISGAEFTLASYVDGKVTSEVVYTGVSGTDGTIQWKKGDVAVSEEISIQEGTYLLQETYAPSGCLKSDEKWIISFNAEGIPSSIDKIVKNGEEESIQPVDVNSAVEEGIVVITCIFYNELFYQLPETGGSGTILYTMAGAVVVLCGAGLLYRKKIRERRV